MSKSEKKQKNKEEKRHESYILWFSDIRKKDVGVVGGKNASLGEMYSLLSSKGVAIPNGFATTAQAYWDFLNTTGIYEKIKKELKNLRTSDITSLSKTGKYIRTLILEAKFPEILEKEIIKGYHKLEKESIGSHFSVAVRSSATAEDLPNASFAGQQETFLHIRGEEELLDAVKKCMASLFTNRAMSYRDNQGFDHLQVALSVTIQKMINADTGSSGVMFTLDTESGFRDVCIVTSGYGLGEYVVQGKIIPDQFTVFKPTLKKGFPAIISRRLGSKEEKLIAGKIKGVMRQVVNDTARNVYSILDEDVLSLAKWGIQIEEHYNTPQDIEWVKESGTGKLYIVQARPETIKSRDSGTTIIQYVLKKESKPVLEGSAVGQRIGAGKVRIIEDPKDMKLFKTGEVLVTRMTDPDWEPIMKIASAIITEQGGKTSHAAIVSRELGVPCVVGVSSARKILKNGKPVTVSCAEGEIGKIYAGVLPFEIKKTELKDIPNTKTQIMMNVGDPDHAFGLSSLPTEGIGLAREEFIFSNFIKVHPLALLNYKKIKDSNLKKQIDDITVGYKIKSNYLVDKLSDGIGRLAASVYPRDTIIRLTDFKTNEYAKLLGGSLFEPDEENPMLGWRGASRYYSKEYAGAFELECIAIKRAREDWGLQNIIVMVPFCRTPEEGQKVLATMEKYGLKRGQKGLQVYVMCEIPSNVILAEDFAKIFDGFSIGSNDLTQLTLGVDRDSPLVSHIYNEKNKAVTTLIKDVITTAHAHDRKVGICGQAPSDYPEFAEFLVRAGIDSISLNPDTVVETRKRIADMEKTIGKKGKRAHLPLLSFVVLWGVVAIGFVALGAGCLGFGKQINTSNVGKDTIAPAEIREKTEQKISKQKDEEFEKLLTPLTFDSFAQFSISYPIKWTVNYWNGGVTFTNKETREYVSIFKQIIGHPVANKEKAVVDGYTAYHFIDTVKKNSAKFAVIEIEFDGIVIEVNGNSQRLYEMIDTFKFTSSTITSDRDPTHWDIRERRFCVQMITYAHKDKEDCQPFSSPCDVPDGWKVCDDKDI